MEHITDRLREPLNDTTRKARRNLLAVSVIGIITTKVGLVPTKITAFGIEFSAANLEALMTLLALATLYFLLTFVTYVFSELQAWQVLITSQELEKFKERTEVLTFHSSLLSTPNYEFEEEFRLQAERIYSKTKPVFYFRLSVELIVPVLISMYAIVSAFRIDVSVFF
ncbi:hypothetical protein SD340_004302 [Vibrio fluvialis]|nr:hypothetical protein [Vibrio fluvialis]EKO3528652.1 hypothetical protein [Vibrio fluvialis]ELC0660917.1 hypothetical protein [Vibrio fluvialis]ELU8402388.1 hypothetical protein [Vibrio fluvialis]